MLCIVVVDHSFSCWPYLCAEGTFELDVVVADIVILFSVVGVVGVWAGVEASSEAWRQCVMCR